MKSTTKEKALIISITLAIVLGLIVTANVLRPYVPMEIDDDTVQSRHAEKIINSHVQ